MIIGYSSLGGTSTPISGTTGRLLYGTGQQDVLSENQEAYRAFIGYAGANNTNMSNFAIGIYDISGGNVTTAPRLCFFNLQINNAVEGANTTQRFIEIPLTVFDLSAHAGKTLAIGFADPAANTGFNIPLTTVAGANRKNHNGANSSMPSTMANASVTSNQAWSMYIETRTKSETPDPTLDGVTPTPFNNSQQLTATVTGDMAAGTVAMLGDGLAVPQSVVSWSYDSGTNKTTIITNVSQGGIPFGSVTVRYTSGSLVLTSNTLTFNPVSSNAVISIAGPQNGPGYVFEQMESGSYLNVTQLEHNDSPNTVVSSSGMISQAVVRSFQARARDSSDKTWSTFSTINPYIGSLGIGVESCAPPTDNGAGSVFESISGFGTETIPKPVDSGSGTVSEVPIHIIYGHASEALLAPTDAGLGNLVTGIEGSGQELVLPTVDSAVGLVNAAPLVPSLRRTFIIYP